ncbi:BolA family protein [Haliangium sp. UPWRP_2]|uniref:BolA family protein n=1 Tax=Haliangium sp. UPWRP_2 TaxID=1931276 RepID=UPI000B539224|nr:BolA family protein [Haliangium sp. UPWRP_2]PSM32058.1 BolA family transcriptional regulator [Haliangium sp. UPWRP_2]HNN96428.1 BolA family protein [Pseudomonadota bacterium]
MSMQSTIEAKLRGALAPVHLEVINESHNHSGPPNAESHFKVIVVSEQFVGRSLIEQQRLVNAALAEELKGAVHALSMKTLTPERWQAAGGQVKHETPLCHGGSKH